MAYLDSSNIKVFPAVNRTATYDPYARHTSEQTLSGIINKFIDSDGFVITPSDQIDKDAEFAFNIHGYYFKVTKLQNILDILELSTESAACEVWAKITIEQHGADTDTNKWFELKGQDDETTGKYNSVDFYTSEPSITSSTTEFKLHLFNYSDSSCSVPDDSFRKFFGRSFTIDVIDGQTV